MPGGLELLATGTFTSDGVVQNIDLPGEPDLFKMYNITKFGSTAAITPTMRSKWIRGLADDAAYVDTKTNGAATIDITSMVTSNGFTLVDTSDQTPAALNTTGTAVTAANPAVVSATSTTGLLDGNIVRMFNVINMQQISGMDFTIGSVVANTSFELSHLDASGFAAAGTTNSFRKIPFDPIYYPRRRTITKITQAAQAVVTLSVTHGFTVGQTIRFNIPSDLGMIEMDGLLGEITAINTTNNTITVDINSSGFTAFAFPVSADVPYTFAQAIPVGDDALILDGATDNVATIQIQCGSSTIGAASDVMRWFAYKHVAII